MKGYPRGFEAVLWTVCAGVLVSGLLLAPTTFEMRLAWHPPWRLGADSRVGVAATHAALGVAMCFIAGALWSLHMRLGWRRRRQRKTGAAIVACLAGLASSALGVYYLGDAALADGVALVHLALGVAIAGPLAWHAWKRSTRKDRTP